MHIRIYVYRSRVYTTGLLAAPNMLVIQLFIFLCFLGSKSYSLQLQASLDQKKQSSLTFVDQISFEEEEALMFDRIMISTFVTIKEVSRIVQLSVAKSSNIVGDVLFISLNSLGTITKLFAKNILILSFDIQTKVKNNKYLVANAAILFGYILQNISRLINGLGNFLILGGRTLKSVIKGLSHAVEDSFISAENVIQSLIVYIRKMLQPRYDTNTPYIESSKMTAFSSQSIKAFFNKSNHIIGSLTFNFQGKHMPLTALTSLRDKSSLPCFSRNSQNKNNHSSHSTDLNISHNISRYTRRIDYSNDNHIAHDIVFGHFADHWIACSLCDDAFIAEDDWICCVFEIIQLCATSCSAYMHHAHPFPKITEVFEPHTYLFSSSLLAIQIPHPVTVFSTNIKKWLSWKNESKRLGLPLHLDKTTPTLSSKSSINAQRTANFSSQFRHLNESYFSPESNNSKNETIFENVKHFNQFINKESVYFNNRSFQKRWLEDHRDKNYHMLISDFMLEIPTVTIQLILLLMTSMFITGILMKYILNRNRYIFLFLLAAVVLIGSCYFHFLDKSYRERIITKSNIYAMHFLLSNLEKSIAEAVILEPSHWLNSLIQSLWEAKDSDIDCSSCISVAFSEHCGLGGYISNMYKDMFNEMLLENRRGLSDVITTVNCFSLGRIAPKVLGIRVVEMKNASCWSKSVNRSAPSFHNLDSSSGVIGCSNLLFNIEFNFVSDSMHFELFMKSSSEDDKMRETIVGAMGRSNENSTNQSSTSIIQQSNHSYISLSYHFLKDKWTSLIKITRNAYQSSKQLPVTTVTVSSFALSGVLTIDAEVLSNYPFLGLAKV